MKKSISKITAIALTAVMTSCLTSCEDQRNIPTYGTGLENDVESKAPRSFVYFDESHIDDGDNLCLHLTIGNANSPMSARELVSVKVVGGDGAKYTRLSYNTDDYDASDIDDSILEYGYKYHVVYAFYTLFTESDTATVTVTDNYSGEIIGEWEVDVSGIMDVPWIH